MRSSSVFLSIGWFYMSQLRGNHGGVLSAPPPVVLDGLFSLKLFEPEYCCRRWQHDDGEDLECLDMLCGQKLWHEQVVGNMNTNRFTHVHTLVVLLCVGKILLPYFWFVPHFHTIWGMVFVRSGNRQGQLTELKRCNLLSVVSHN